VSKKKGSPQIGLVPPHSDDAEAAVLGAILLDSRALYYVADLLKPEDFYHESYGNIYRACLQLSERNEPVDNVTVCNELESMGLLDKVGGYAAIANLQASVPTSANVEHYALIVARDAVKRRLIQAGYDISRLGYDQSLDAEQALNEAQGIIFGLSEQGKVSEFAQMGELLRSAMQRIDVMQERGRPIVGISSGFYDLDNITNGFRNSELIIVAARPSMGKTSFALNVAVNAALKENLPVAVFSLEMTKEQLVERILCSFARINAQHLHRGTLSEEEYERLASVLGPLEKAPIYIDDAPIVDELQLFAKARRARIKYGIGLIILDYLQLMKGRYSDENRVLEVSSISRSLKSLARDLDVPVIAISQLNRSPENRPDKRPMLADLRESGCLAAQTMIYLNDGVARPIGCSLHLQSLSVLAKPVCGDYVQTHVATKVFVSGTKKLYRVETESGKSIEATLNHPFLTPTGWKSLEKLQPGSYIAVIDDKQWNTKYEKILKVAYTRTDLVYDMTVPNVHNFVANGFIVHNSIEQDADLVLFIYREDVYRKPDEPHDNIAELIVAKHRNGPTGTVKLRFVKEHTRFENLDVIHTLT